MAIKALVCTHWGWFSERVQIALMDLYDRFFICDPDAKYRGYTPYEDFLTRKFREVEIDRPLTGDIFSVSAPVKPWFASIRRSSPPFMVVKIDFASAVCWHQRVLTWCHDGTIVELPPSFAPPRSMDCERPLRLLRRNSLVLRRLTSLRFQKWIQGHIFTLNELATVPRKYKRSVILVKWYNDIHCSSNLKAL